MTLKLRICNACGWAHFPLTRAEVEAQARRFGEYLTREPPEVQAHFGFGPLSATGREWDFDHHVAESAHCFKCGNRYTNFRDETDADRAPVGSTLQGIIVDAGCR